MKAARAEAPGQLSAPSHAETIAAIRLIRSPSIGPRTFYQLIKLYGTAERAAQAAPDMARRGGKKDFALVPEKGAEAELARLDKLGARALLWCEEAYPALLRQIADAPPILNVLGNVELLAKPAIAMVGARNASLNGCRMAEQLAGGLTNAGYSVASGLARGIDAAAHKGAGIVHTIAVLGGGIDHIYPRENEALYHAIAKEGLLVSECSPGTVPHAEHFPRRNRIISGVSLGVVVVEAATRSGSLITARQALEQGREVMAVPGHPLDPRAEGPNKLIREGATLITSVEDILETVTSFRSRAEDFRLEESGDAYRALDERAVEDIRERLVSLLNSGATPVDDLIAECGDARAVLAALLELELGGKIIRHPGNKVGLL